MVLALNTSHTLRASQQPNVLTVLYRCRQPPSEGSQTSVQEASKHSFSRPLPSRQKRCHSWTSSASYPVVIGPFSFYFLLAFLRTKTLPGFANEISGAFAYLLTTISLCHPMSMTLPSSTENWASCDPAPESVTVSFGRGNEKHLSSSLLTLTQLAFYREKLKFSSRVHGHDHAPFRGPAPGPCHDHGSARISSCPCYGLCHRKAAYAGHQCPWSWPSSGGTSTLSVMLWPYACLSLSGWLTVDVALLRESEASECHQELLAFRHHQHHLLMCQRQPQHLWTQRERALQRLQREPQTHSIVLCPGLAVPFVE
mmetsp:Transcript_89971/g.178822  ORF Transcript_89971/g.178822 Transcript_89971/m.178822 type:complete len:312 (-) Transcript_89971:794-1729(-)